MTKHWKRSRITKALTDAARASSFEEAEARLDAVCITVVVAADQATTRAGQAAALTAIVTARKCFGRVTLVSESDIPLIAKLPWVQRFTVQHGGSAPGLPESRLQERRTGSTLGTWPAVMTGRSAAGGTGGSRERVYTTRRSVTPGWLSPECLLPHSLSVRSLDAAGWTADVIERRHHGDIRLNPGDPPYLLSGLDRVEPRRVMAKHGFDYMIDAGLGHGPHDFEGMQLRVIAKDTSSEDLWNAPEHAPEEALSDRHENAA